MLVKLEALVGAIATLQTVSASAVARRQYLTELPTVSEDIESRLQGEARIGDVCHPIGSYTLGGSELIPPCIAEQAINLKCEAITAVRGANGASPAQWKAYQQCLSGEGASYFQEVKGCLACKEAHGYLSSQQAAFFTDRYDEAEADFTNSTSVSKTVWEHVTARIGVHWCVNQTSNAPLNDWPCYNQLDKASGVATRNQTVKDYYKNAPKSQNVGQFSLNGKQYPEVSVGARLSTILNTVYQVVSEISYVYDVRVAGGKYNISTKYDAHTEVKVSQEFSQIKCFYNFTKPDTFTIVSTVSPPVPVANSTREVLIEQAAAVQPPACSNCSDIEISMEGSRAMAATIKPAPKGIVDAAKAVMRDLEKNDSSEVKESFAALSQQIKSDFAAEVQQEVHSSHTKTWASSSFGDLSADQKASSQKENATGPSTVQSSSKAGSVSSSEYLSANQKANSQEDNASHSIHLQTGSSNNAWTCGPLKIKVCSVDDPNNCREAVI